jgi:endo-1,4-beta-xylanase
MDHLAAFATSRGLKLHMHNLIWSVALPRWVVPAIAEGRAANIMARHIATLVNRYQDHVDSWDVVNEPADPRWPSGPEGLCTTPWRRALGADYLRRALMAAHDGNPRARLLINDDDLEYDTPDRQKKRDIYLRLLTALRQQGVPLHGFGLEAHLKPWLAIAEAPYRRFLADLAGLDLTIYVTELDVCDRALPADTRTRDVAVAAMTRRYLDLVLDERAVTTVMTWGLCDRTTWMRQDRAGQRDDGLPPRPLPYDVALRAKPMREALMTAFRHAPGR